ncbi:nuclear transport factor 2 family protein [Amycolatopsis sp. NPDC005003]
MSPSEAPTRQAAVLAMTRHFYDCVDAADAAGAAALFAANATYHRPGYDPYAGPEGILRFYTRDRAIRSGRHVLTTVLAVGGDVAVRGEFHGVGRDGRPVDLRFADFFEVGPDHLFTRRDTFFFAPLT